MTGHKPSFEDFVELDVPAQERARLRAAHDLLIAAGLPPELPPSLAVAPAAPVSAGKALLRRRRFTAIAATAVVALGLFGAGYAVGLRGADAEPVWTVSMTGATGEAASIDVLPRDTAGNWPMTLRVTGLASLPRGETYTLWLTRKGELAAPCGTFTVAGSTEVPLNAPYPLREYDGWVVVRTGTARPFLLATRSV